MDKEVTKKKKSLFKKIIIIIFSVFLFFITSVSIIAYIFEEDIADIALKQMYKMIKTETTHSKISFSLLKKFPMASLEVKDLNIKALDSDSSLFSAKKVFLQFNIIDIITSNYILKQIEVNNASLSLEAFKNGKNNWDVFSLDDTTSDLSINLQTIVLQDIKFRFNSHPNEIYVQTFIHNLSAKGDFSNKIFNTQLRTNLSIDTINTKEFTLGKKKIDLSANIQIDSENQTYAFEKGNLKLDKFLFVTNLNLEKEKNNWKYALQLRGNQISLKDISSLFPCEMQRKMDIYKPGGMLNLDLSVNGKTNTSTLNIDAGFSVKKGKVTQTENKITLSNIHLTGDFKSRSTNVMQSAEINISEFNAAINNKSIQGTAFVKNLSSPFVKLEIVADVDLKDWQAFLPKNYIYKTEGNAFLDVRFENKFSSIKKITQKDFKNCIFDGNISLSDGTIQLQEDEFKLEKLYGTLNFNNQEIEINEIDGQINTNAFHVNGKIDQLFDYLFVEGEKLKITALFESPHFDLNKQLKKNPEKSKKKDFLLSFPKSIDFNLVLKIDELSFEKFKASNISGKAVLLQDKFSVSKLSLSTFEGKVIADASLQETNNETFIVSCKAIIKQSDIEKMFYSLNNFGQKEITDKNLRGKADAVIELNAKMKNNLEIIPESIHCSADLLIENGELNNYKTLESLSKFIHLEDLRNIKFETLENHIEIKNSTIYIPEMEIKNNALDLTVSGEQTFAGKINYSIRLRLNELLANKFHSRNKKKEDFGEIMDDETGNMFIHLSILGDLDNIVFKRDKKKSKESFNKKMQDQKQELRELFGKDKKEEKTESNSAENENANKKESNKKQSSSREIEIDDNW